MPAASQPLLPAAAWQPLGSSLPPLGELAVYRVAWADFLPLPASLLTLVPPDEQGRATRYVQPADQARFLVGRAVLRYLLGRHLGLLPAAVPLSLTPFGKPELATPSGIHFNLSHSGAWIVMVLAPYEVGVDVEEMLPDFDYGEIASYHFGPAARRHLQQSSDPRGTFYHLWTRREALAKAIGRGLDDTLSEDTVPLPSWQLHSFAVATGYPAALAYPAAGQPVLRFITLDAWLLR